MTERIPAPALDFFAQLRVQVGPVHEIGPTPAGNRRVIPITGGTVQGDGWTARVLPGGADFQAIVTPSLARLDARYVLETDGYLLDPKFLHLNGGFDFQRGVTNAELDNMDNSGIAGSTPHGANARPRGNASATNAPK